MSTMDPARAALLGIRLALVALALTAAVIAFVETRRPVTRVAGAAASYVCPMHPDVTATAPGTCPVCRMALVPVRPPETRGNPAAAPDAPPSDAAVAMRPVATSMRAPAWIEADGLGVAILYDDEIAMLDREETGVFRADGSSAREVPIRVVADQSERWDDATAAIRFRLDDVAAVPPGAVGSVQLAPRSRSLLVVPAAALLRSPDGVYVLVATEPSRFEHRPVRAGRVVDGYAAVLGGVAAGERVVVSDAFFLDAAQRLDAESTAR